MTLFLSGERPEEAVERLRAVISCYADDATERHFVEWAATCLLKHEFHENRPGFAEAFSQLRDRCLDAGCRRFPGIHPHQEEIAEMAVEAGAVSVLRELLPKLKSRSPMPRKLKKKLADWQSWREQQEDREP